MVKRKKVAKKSDSKAPQAAAKAAALDGELPSEAEESDDDAAQAPVEEEDDGFFETPDEKRIRLAKEYLSKLEEAKPGEVQERLVEDVKEKTRRATAEVQELTLGEPQYRRGHRLAPTCVCMRGDEAELFTGGKDCAILRWDVEAEKKMVLHEGGKNQFECGGHFAPVHGVAWVEQKQLLLSVGDDRLVRFWDTRLPPKSACVDQLFGHEGPVSSIVVDPSGDRAYTVSSDKTLKIWDIKRRRIIDTLMGHVGPVTCLDIHSEGRPVSGAMDKTVRLWKVHQDTHLIFNRHTYSVDAVAALDFQRCLSGSQDGSLLLWSHLSKKPVAKAQLDKGQWVTALGCIRASNVAFCGSAIGELSTWRVEQPAAGSADTSLRLSSAAPKLSMVGSINAIAVGQRFVVCAVGKEQRGGRWFYERGQKNGLVLVPLSYKLEKSGDE